MWIELSLALLVVVLCVLVVQWAIKQSAVVWTEQAVLLMRAEADFRLAHPLQPDQHGYRMQFNGEVPKAHPQWILYPPWLEAFREQLRLAWPASVGYAKVK